MFSRRDVVRGLVRDSDRHECATGQEHDVDGQDIHLHDHPTHGVHRQPERLHGSLPVEETRQHPHRERKQKQVSSFNKILHCFS